MNAQNGLTTTSGTAYGTGDYPSGYWPYHEWPVQHWYQPNYYIAPYYPQTVEKEVEPKSCMGKAHVFECDHVERCQCGKIQRVMPREPKTAKAKK